MGKTLLDIIGEDIIGTISEWATGVFIGTIRAHQLKNGEWHAYIVAEGRLQEMTYQEDNRGLRVKEYMSGRHIAVIKDDRNDEIIIGATRKELIKKLKHDPPGWWILCSGLLIWFESHPANWAGDIWAFTRLSVRNIKLFIN